MFEGSVRILNAEVVEPDVATLDVRGASGAVAAVRATSADGSGFFGGKDPLFNQPTGVYGESSHEGVVGNSKGSVGLGVLGMANQNGSNLNPDTGGTGVLGSGYIGIRGETRTGVAVLGRTFPPGGQAARFEGSVTVTGNHQCGGDLTVARNFTVNGNLLSPAEDSDKNSGLC